MTGERARSKEAPREACGFCGAGFAVPHTVILTLSFARRKDLRCSFLPGPRPLVWGHEPARRNFRVAGVNHSTAPINYHRFPMRISRFLLMVFFGIAAGAAYAQGTVPTFRYKIGQTWVTLPGQSAAQAGTQSGAIPTVLVPVRLEFDSQSTAGKPLTLDAAADVQPLLQSPVFAKAPFGDEGTTQYVDAMLRATLGKSAGAGWHTLLAPPEVRPLTVEIPAGFGYVLTSKRTGTALGMADAEYVRAGDLPVHCP